MPPRRDFCGEEVLEGGGARRGGGVRLGCRTDRRKGKGEVSERGRYRENSCVCERERERVCVCARERVCAREGVCVRERERVCVRERESVCKRERERVCVCV